MSGTQRAAELDDGVRTTTAGRVRLIDLAGGRRNALTPALLEALAAALHAADGDPDVRAVVLAGADGQFSAGADLREGAESLHRTLKSDGAHEPLWLEPVGRLTRQLLEMATPSVVAIDGAAVGGGATLALGADLRIMSEGARIGFPFVNLGITPEGLSSRLLPEVVGRGRALELLLSGRLVGAQEALRMGLVSAVSEHSARDAAAELAGRIAEAASPSAAPAPRRQCRRPIPALASICFASPRRGGRGRGRSRPAAPRPVPGY